jgi:drug/metabolite transporter (DMT)-like permease
MCLTPLLRLLRLLLSSKPELCYVSEALSQKPLFVLQVGPIPSILLAMDDTVFTRSEMVEPGIAVVLAVSGAGFTPTGFGMWCYQGLRRTGSTRLATSK